jgi:class 3 adenylate cyclase
MAVKAMTVEGSKSRKVEAFNEFCPQPYPMRFHVQGLPRRNYIPRTIGFTLLGILSLERWWTSDHSTILLGGAAFVFVWPHLALLLAAHIQREAQPKDEKAFKSKGISRTDAVRMRDAEYRNLYMDAFLGGCFMSLYGFSLWQTQAILAVLCANNMSLGGVGLFARGFAAMLVGVGVTIAVVGFHFQPYSSVVGSVSAVAFTFAYIVFTNYVTFRQARSLIAARKKSEQQRQEILRQSEILAEQAREIELANTKLQEKNLEIETERAQSERLLLNILPSSIAARLMGGEQLIADRFDHVTVMFADIADFTTISATIRPEELVGLLDTVFSAFDAIANTYQLEKIKTIGDCYMLVGGLPEPQSDHCERVARAALDIHNATQELNSLLDVQLSLRIGIHTGPVVAGVIGRTKFAYDLWGDTVNTASRMESHGKAGAIHISQEVRDALAGSAAAPSATGRFATESCGTTVIKGKGAMHTYFLTGFVPKAIHATTDSPLPSRPETLQMS